MRHSKAYVRWGKDGSVCAMCIIVDYGQAVQALRSLQRSYPEAPVAQVSVARALKLMRARGNVATQAALLEGITARRHRLRQGNI